MNSIAKLFPSIETANKMLEMLDDGDLFTFQTFDDSKPPKQGMARIYNGSLEQHFEALQRLNQQGCGVFVTVNETDLQGRKTENIKRIRGLWIDFDTVNDARVEQLVSMDFPPNLIVESSRGKHHAYWLIREGEIALDQFTSLQKRLIHHFADDGADKAIHNVDRVMRLAGFIHQKDTPFQSRIVHSDAWHDADDLIQWVQSLREPLELPTPKAHAAKAKPQVTHTTQQTHFTLDFKQAKLLARGRWSEILGRLGYALTTHAPHEHGSCPMCGGSDRFRFDDENGDGSFICSQGTGETIAGNGFTLLEHGGYSIAEALKAVTQVLAGMGLISEYDSDSTTRKWGEPKEIKAELLPVAPFDRAMLPYNLGEYCCDEANRADNMPPDFVAVCTLVALCSVVGARVGIKPKRLDDWTVIPNLWGGIVAPPSSKKSPAFNAGTYALDRLVINARAEYDEALKEYEVSSLVKESSMKALKDKLKDAGKKGDEEKLNQIANELRELQDESIGEPILKRYKTNDASPEALAELEKLNPNGILVCRDELVGLLSSLDKNDSDSGRAFYLEGWNGNKPYEFDRIMRGNGFIENHCLSVLGGIQPDKLVAYLEPSIKGMGNDGLLQRFQLLVYPDTNNWAYRDEIPNKDARNAVFEVFQALDNLTTNEIVRIGAKPADEYNPRPYFRFSEEAQELFIAWTTHLHSAIMANEEHPIIIQHLDKYGKLMPALALIFHLIDGVQLGRVGDVSKRCAEMAIEWCEYLETHARRIYGLVLQSATMKAGTLCQKLKNLKDDDWRTKGFTSRQVQQKNWKGLTDTGSVNDALDILVDSDWLALEEIEPTIKGGRPSKRYWINPRIFEKS